MNVTKSAIALALSLSLAGTTLAQSGEQNPPTTGPVAGQIVVGDPVTDPIRAHDVVKVTVVGAPYLSDNFPVDKDGYIFHPGARKRFFVSGLTRLQASELIRKRILELQLLKRADVGVSYVSRKAREVSIGGAVQTAVRQLLRDGDQLSDVLGRAVPAQGADLSRITLTRGERRVAVNYKRFTAGLEDGSAVNPKLEDGDRIFVPAGEISGGNIRVRGEVKDTTKVVIPIIEGTTVGLILQSVGGITDLADKGAIYVQRGGERVTVPYDDIVKGVKNRDIKLLDKDEIVVPKLERPRQVQVAGAGVLRPMTVPLTSGLTLAQAIATAGGTQKMKKTMVRLERLSADGKSSTSQEYDLTRGGGAAVALQDGDIITVDYNPPKQSFDVNQAAGLLSGVALFFSLFRR